MIDDIIKSLMRKRLAKDVIYNIIESKTGVKLNNKYNSDNCNDK